MHVRQRVAGTPQRPRLTVSRSLKHITAQVIDDEARRTVVFFSTVSTGEGAIDRKQTKTKQAEQLGKAIARLALAAGVKEVVFDRNQYRYHGRVKAVAEGARAGGLTF